MGLLDKVKKIATAPRYNAVDIVVVLDSFCIIVADQIVREHMEVNL